MSEERLQKILAHAGFGSRRACEQYILSGRVRVNGQLAELGQKADPAVDKITMDGRPVLGAREHIYIALNKPRYVLSTVEAEKGDGRATVRSLIPLEGHLYPVGRLDIDSEGLILLTNDGELANRLTHPRYQHEKEYKVLVARHPDPEQLSAWRRGIFLEDGHKTQPVNAHVTSLSGKGAWMRVTLREGRKRQIREMGMLTGLPVVSIIRVRIGSLLLGNLKPGAWRHLTPQEVKALKDEKHPVKATAPGSFRRPSNFVPYRKRSADSTNKRRSEGNSSDKPRSSARRGPTPPPNKPTNKRR